MWPVLLCAALPVSTVGRRVQRWKCMGGLVGCIRAHEHNIQGLAVGFGPPSLSCLVSDDLPVVADHLH